MHKKAVLLFLVPILLPLLSSIANAGCCFDVNRDDLFCTDTPDECANYDPTALCSDNCYSVADACCLDNCMSAKVGSVFASPRVCTDSTKFTSGACDQFPECDYGCVFCSGKSNALRTTYVAYSIFSVGLKECSDYGESLSWFEPTNNEDNCGLLKQNDTRMPTMYKITGCVKDEKQSLINGVTVSAANKSDSTENGCYELTNMPKGSYTIHALKQGFTTDSETKYVTSNISVDFSLTKLAIEEAGTLGGRVYYLSSLGDEFNIVDATVSVEGHTDKTGTDGRYTIESIPVRAQAYSVTVTPLSTFTPALEPLYDSVQINPGATTKNFNLRLKSAVVAELTVSVVNSSNAPFTGGANIVITKLGAIEQAASATTPSTGIYKVNLTMANYTVVVYKEKYEATPDQQNVNLDRGRAVTAALVYKSLADRSISGVVRDSETEKVIGGVSVFIQAPLKQLMKYGSTQDSSGRYVIDGLIHTNYTLIAQKSGYIEGSIRAEATTESANIELTPARCLTDAALPNITRITIQKAPLRTNISLEFNATCNPSLIYIYRCKGTDCITQPIKGLKGDATKFSDTNVEPGASYKYQIMAYYDSGLLGRVFSEPKTISLGVEECFSKHQNDQVCIGNTRYKCNTNNTVTELKDLAKKALCIYTSETETVYSDSVSCAQCNPPLGLFSYIGQFQLTRAGVIEPVSCSATNFLSYPEARNCYIDYTQTAVNKYLSCEDVESCYDYKSEGACKENKCMQNTPCHWNSHISAMGMGVCVPDDTALHDCSKCNQPGKFNELFMSCTEDLCKKYGNYSTGGDAKKTTCYFTADNRCINIREATCEDYSNSFADCGDHLVGYWQMEQVNTKDLSGFGNVTKDGIGNASLVNVKPGVVGNCLNFSGQADGKSSVNISNFSLAPNSKVTFEAWVKTDDITKDQKFMIKRDVYLSIDTNGRANFVTNQGTVTGTSALQNSVWYHIAGTYDRSALKIYVNGNLNGSKQASGNLNTGLYPLYLGRYLNGYLDEVRVWDKALTAAEVKRNYEAGLAGNPARGSIADLGVTNAVDSPSTDYFNYGLCKFSLITHNGRCAKDADNNNLGDLNPADMQAPYTVVLHPIKTNSISFDYVIYDPVNNTPIGDADTFFNLTRGQPPATPVLKTFLEAEGKISYPVTGEGNDGNYTVFYYSEDNAHNLEKIRNFTVILDQTEPKMKASWIYSGGNDITLTLKSSEPEEIVSCSAVLYDKDGNALQTENNLMTGEPAKSFSRTYSLEDGIYYYDYVCYDLVGNPAEGRKTMLVDRDTIIFNGLPNGTINYDYVTLSVETAIAAQCRYSENQMSSDDDFTYADAFATDDQGIHHTAYKNLAGNKNNAFSYYVKCRSKETGEYTRSAAPKIVFSIDKTEPKTTVINTAETEWKMSASIYFICSDEPIYGPYPEFGCDYTKYCLTEQGSTCQPTKTAYWLMLYSYQTVCYQSVDMGGNAEKINCIQPKVDRSAPRAKMLIPDKVTNNETLSVDAEINNSAVKISPEQSPIKSVLFRIEGVVVKNVSNIPTKPTFNFTNNNMKINLSLSDTLTKTVNSQGNSGLLTVEATDSAGNIGTSPPILIVFDKWGPAEPPKLDPALNKYHESGYPLYFHGNSYYTNQNHIYISGNTDEKIEYITFNVNNTKVNEYRQPQTVKIDSSLFKTSSAALNGSNKIVVSGISRTEMQGYVNKYRYLEFASHSREKYGNYSKFYRIMGDVTTEGTGGGNIALMLDAPLEQDVAARTSFSLYNQSMPAKTFIASVDLSSKNAGISNNTVYVGQKDYLGNYGASTDSFNVIYENIMPILSNPLALTDDGAIALANNSKFQSVNGFNFTIGNVKFGLRDDTIVKANGVPLSANIINVSDETFIINVPSKLEDGHYLIELSAVEYAGNTNYTRWEIDVDKFAPRMPLAKMLNAYGKAPDGYMLTRNQTPAFNIYYRNDNTLVQINSSQVIIKDLKSYKILRNAVDCTSAQLNNFTCSVNMVLNESDYELVIKSFKQLAESKNYAEHSVLFAVDRTEPDITNFNLGSRYVTNLIPIGFWADIKRGSETHPLKARIRLNSTINNNKLIYLMNITPETVIDLLKGEITPENLWESGISLSHGEHWTLSANISDYAGNYDDTNSRVMIVDTLPPTLRNVVINAIPIYDIIQNVSEGVEVILGENQSRIIYNYVKYTVSNDIISIIGNASDADSGVRELRVYRADEQIGPVLRICKPYNFICVNGTSGSFTFQTNSTVIGEVGAVIKNRIYIRVIDNASNEIMEPFFINRDIEKPKVRICVEGGAECVGEGPEEVVVMKDFNEIKQTCGKNEKCYNTIITNTCNYLELTTGVSKDQCYKNYIVDIEKAELYLLCLNTFMYKDTCLFDLAKMTGVASPICDEIGIKGVKSDLRSRCYTTAT